MFILCLCWQFEQTRPTLHTLTHHKQNKLRRRWPVAQLDALVAWRDWLSENESLQKLNGFRPKQQMVSEWFLNGLWYLLRTKRKVLGPKTWKHKTRWKLRQIVVLLQLPWRYGGHQGDIDTAHGSPSLPVATLPLSSSWRLPASQDSSLQQLPSTYCTT